MKARTAAGLLALMGCMSVAASTDDSDGNQLLPACQATIRAIDGTGGTTHSTGYCLGVVHGVSDMLAIYKDKLPVKFCVPSTISYGQSVRIVTKYLQDNPAMLNNHDPLLVLLALQDAYPCK